VKVTSSVAIGAAAVGGVGHHGGLDDVRTLLDCGVLGAVALGGVGRDGDRREDRDDDHHDEQLDEGEAALRLLWRAVCHRARQPRITARAG
jgi:hypothetical protein